MAWPMQVLEEPSILTLGSTEDSMQSQEGGEAEAEPDEGPKKDYSDFSVPFGAGFRGEYS